VLYPGGSTGGRNQEGKNNIVPYLEKTKKKTDIQIIEGLYFFEASAATTKIISSVYNKLMVCVFGEPQPAGGKGL